MSYTGGPHGEPYGNPESRYERLANRLHLLEEDEGIVLTPKERLMADLAIELIGAIGSIDGITVYSQ